MNFLNRDSVARITVFSGNHSLLRTHVAAVSTGSDRSRAMAVVSGGVAFGTIIGPGTVPFTPFLNRCFKVSSSYLLL